MLYILLFVVFVLFFVLKPITCFVTFADTKYKKTLDRIHSEARGTKLFDEVYALNEEDLSADFMKKHSKFISENQRGYGYWIWKPQVILQALQRVPDGSIVIYADAGCTFDNSKSSELSKYISDIDDKGILAFQFQGGEETGWTKKDTIKQIFPDMLDSPQIIATAIIFKKCKFSVEFVKEWLSYCEDYHLLDDTESEGGEISSFNAHRHDQSIFSLMCKKYKIKTLPNTVDGEGPIKSSRLKY